jgi:glycyl-tRNA synthetase
MPTAVMGEFNSEFLQLPREVLISVMKKHQRYFPITPLHLPPFSGKMGGEKEGGEGLLPHFIAIRNGDDIGIDLVRQGNEHVLGARFADANFFVREDLKHKLEEFRPKLSGLIFQTKLGSMLDKSERMLKLSAEIGEMLNFDNLELSNLQRATFLAKADLATQMVTEMTSLQGIIGREYAVRSGEHAEVALAIGEQYQPVPKSRIGVVVALADRIDSLVGLFAAGLIPTGAKDPFGLRRAAIGVVQPLIEHNISFDLREAIKQAAKSQPIAVSDEVQNQVLEFIAGRLSVVLKDAGYKYDVVDAVLAEQSFNPAASADAVKQLQVWVERKDWNTILPAFARCVRITRDQKQTFKVNPKDFAEKAEEALFKALEKAESAKRRAGSVDDFLNAFVPMIPAVNEFFDKVLVMADDKALKENRLGLLQRIAALSSGVADLSKLEGF